MNLFKLVSSIFTRKPNTSNACGRLNIGQPSPGKEIWFSQEELDEHVRSFGSPVGVTGKGKTMALQEIAKPNRCNDKK